jgi:heparan-alpha-glucosaminide N-acetyltransferase
VPEAARAPAVRLQSLDAFRGAILLLMASSGFGFPQVAANFPNRPGWQFLGTQCEHAAWGGCTAWDLIQPSFMFMVGVALPWSIANRTARGQGFAGLFAHALGRALLLVLLGIFLTSAWSPRTEWVFTNVLAQIGLGYPVLFLAAFLAPRWQWLLALAVLFVYWLAFALYPMPAPGFDWAAIGIPETWPHLSGFAAHWEKNANFAAAFDTWFLNLFPRPAPFRYSAGGYQTLNFVPSLVTMMFGLIAGERLRSGIPMKSKVTGLALAGLAGILAGAVLSDIGLCPMVKRIWTPSWTLFSGGCAALLLAWFVAVVDWAGFKAWSLPMAIAGLNPITLYCLWQLTPGFFRDTLKTHLGRQVFEGFGASYAPIAERVAVLLLFCLILLWMHRRRIYVRL